MGRLGRARAALLGGDDDGVLHVPALLPHVHRHLP